MHAGAPLAYYLHELIRIVWGVAPVAFIFLAMVFLYRAQPTRESYVLRALAGVWLAATGSCRLVFSSVLWYGMAPSGTIFSGNFSWWNLYEKFSSMLWFAEQGAATFFAVAIMVYSRQRLLSGFGVREENAEKLSP